MQQILEDYLRRPGSGGRRGRGGEDLAGNIRITASVPNNSLVISGDKEAIERVKGVIAEVDVEMPEAGNAPRIIRLTEALASNVQAMLTELFSEQRSRSRGGRGRSSVQTPPPVIVADDTSNVLIVRASPQDFANIEKLVTQIDSEDMSNMMEKVRIVQVKPGLDVTELAQSLNQTLQAAGRSPASTGRRGRGGRPTETVSVEPIAQSNSLMLAGEPRQLDVAEALIRQLEEIGPAGGKTAIIIDLKNMSADEIERVLGNVVSENTSRSSGSRRSTPQRGSRGTSRRRR
jgi:type II secretory pathway component GspD/PulD (secretin)